MGAAVGLIDLRGLRALWRMDEVDAGLSLAAFLGVIVFGVLEGIIVTIVLSLLAFVNQSWRPYKAELGRVPGLRGYHDLSREPEGERIPGIVIVRFDAPLFFANGARLRRLRARDASRPPAPASTPSSSRRSRSPTSTRRRSTS